VTRQRSDKPPSERPEPLGRPAAQPSAERLTAAIERRLPPLTNFPVRVAFPPADAYPTDPDAADLRAIRREVRFRAQELADLPDEGERW